MKINQESIQACTTTEQGVEPTIQQMAEKYRLVRERRLELEKEAKALEDGEELRLRNQILSAMAEQGFSSVNISGFGRLSRRTRQVFYVADREKFASGVFRALTQAMLDGTSLFECLLLQSRVSREGVNTYLDEHPDVSLEDLGLNSLDVEGLSVTKA